MNTKFALALLASAVMARGRGNDGVQAYQDYCAKYNKHYDSLGSMVHHMKVFMENKEKVDSLNKANEGTGVTFGINSTSDLTDAEYKKLLGLKKKDNGPLPPRPDIDSSMLGGGRRLNEDMSINWIEQGKVHPVKNQGECGSCWAFAATLVQESMQAIKSG